MSKVEDIQKARHDVELLQHGLEKVSTVLQGAEEVAVVGEQVKRRAPALLLTLAVVAVLTGGVVLIVRSRRRRDAESAQSRPG